LKLWDFVNDTPVVEISIRNTLLGEPSQDRTFLAILDTGYSGFPYVPEWLFRKLRFNRLGTKSARATLADGRSFDLLGSFGSISFPSMENMTVDGFVETSKGAGEILIGMEGVRRLVFELNCCQKTLTAENCS
jgi:predicted aspartyl protease